MINHGDAIITSSYHYRIKYYIETGSFPTIPPNAGNSVGALFLELSANTGNRETEFMPSPAMMHDHV